MTDSEEFAQLYDNMVELERNEFVLEKREARFEEENAELLNEIRALKASIAERKERIRALALAEYERTGKKKLPHGIGIRVEPEFQYDANEALAWAIRTGLALQLDVKAFRKNAVTNGLPFVKITGVPTVTFPTNRENLLGGG